MKLIFTIIVFASFLSGRNAFCQNRGESVAKYFSKIIINPGDSLVVETDTLLVDTLFMHDRGKLKFMNKCVVGISHASIGDRCQFNAAGQHGLNGERLNRFGQSGSDGKDLTISVRFEKLGDLTIVTNGGNGGYGLDGQNSLNAYESGEDGARGGDGGRGGNVDLFYLSPNFTVVVDEVSKHSGFFIAQKSHVVFINAAGGIPGHGGKGGEVSGARFAATPVGTVASYSREAVRGRNGDSGRLGLKGTVRFLKTQ